MTITKSISANEFLNMLIDSVLNTVINTISRPVENSYTKAVAEKELADNWAWRKADAVESIEKATQRWNKQRRVQYSVTHRAAILRSRVQQYYAEQNNELMCSLERDILRFNEFGV